MFGLKKRIFGMIENLTTIYCPNVNKDLFKTKLLKN